MHESQGLIFSGKEDKDWWNWKQHLWLQTVCSEFHSLKSDLVTFWQRMVAKKDVSDLCRKIGKFLRWYTRCNAVIQIYVWPWRLIFGCSAQTLPLVTLERRWNLLWLPSDLGFMQFGPTFVKRLGSFRVVKYIRSLWSAMLSFYVQLLWTRRLSKVVGLWAAAQPLSTKTKHCMVWVRN